MYNGSKRLVRADSCHLNILLFLSSLLVAPSVSKEDFVAFPPPSVSSHFNTTTMRFSVSSLSPFNATIPLPDSDYCILAGLDISVEVNNNKLTEPGTVSITVMDRITYTIGVGGDQTTTWDKTFCFSDSGDVGRVSVVAKSDTIKERDIKISLAAAKKDKCRQKRSNAQRPWSTLSVVFAGVLIISPAILVAFCRIRKRMKNHKGGKNKEIV